MTAPRPRIGTDPFVFGYYAVAEDGNGKLRLLWVERERMDNGATRPAGQWWLPTVYRSMKQAEADLSIRNRYPERIVPPEFAAAEVRS